MEVIFSSHLSAVSRSTSKITKVIALICTQAGLGIGFFTGLNNTGREK